jgi:hypothetical protein
MIKNEYLRFMQTLVANDANDNTRKLTNIILDHLEEITPLGTASGRRVKKICAGSQAPALIVIHKFSCPQNVVIPAWMPVSSAMDGNFQPPSAA